MKKIDITKRDAKFFFFGILFMLLIEMIFDWQGVKESFNEGYNSVTKETVK